MIRDMKREDLKHLHFLNYLLKIQRINIPARQEDTNDSQYLLLKKAHHTIPP